MTSESRPIFPQRIPIWYVEHELDGGMPSEWVYSHSFVGNPIGHIVMPEGMHVDRYADHLRFCADPPKPGAYSVCIASLSTWRAVEAAVNGEFGLSWQAVEKAINHEGKATALGYRGFKP